MSHLPVSKRYQSGCDRGGLDAAAAMIAELAGGTVLQGAVKGAEVTPKDVQVTITLDPDQIAT